MVDTSCNSLFSQFPRPLQAFWGVLSEVSPGAQTFVHHDSFEDMSIHDISGASVMTCFQSSSTRSRNVFSVLAPVTPARCVILPAAARDSFSLVADSNWILAPNVLSPTLFNLIVRSNFFSSDMSTLANVPATRCSVLLLTLKADAFAELRKPVSIFCYSSTDRDARPPP